MLITALLSREFGRISQAYLNKDSPGGDGIPQPARNGADAIMEGGGVAVATRKKDQPEDAPKVMSKSGQKTRPDATLGYTKASIIRVSLG